MKSTNHLFSLSLAASLAVLGAAAPLAAHAEVTGNISVLTKYVLRGITNDTENDGTTVQGGLDWSHAGFYLGYWGSNLDYGKATVTPSTGNTRTGFESDIYGGYSFKAGPVDLKFGLIKYLYTQVDDSDGLEADISAGVGPVTLGAKYLLKDVAWGNKGDTYVTLDFSQDLPSEFKLATTLGYYLYTDNGEFITSTVNSSGFRHLNVALSHPLGKSGADVGITYVVGGEDRQGVQQHNAVVLGLSTGF